MERLTAHLKRRNMKLLQEQELSLPKIIERPINKVCSTNIKMKQSKPIIKYISQTTFNLDQELAQHPQSNNSQKFNVFMDSSVLTHIKRANKYNNGSTKKANTVQLSVNKSNLFSNNNNLTFLSKGKEANKCNLSFILKDKGSFVKQYFNQINYRTNQ